MIPIPAEGFLSPDISEIEINIYKANKAVLDEAESLNRICQSLKDRFLPKDHDGQKIIAICIFIKILNGFQAMVLLARKGLRIESEILLRTILEALFILKLVCSDEEFHRKYISRDALQRKKLLNIAQTNDYQVFEATRKLITEEFMKEIDEEVASSGVSEGEFAVEQIAKRAKMHDLYESVYRIASDPVHTSIRSLSDYVKADPAGNIVSFYSGPLPDVSRDVDTALTILINAVDLLDHLFGFAKSPELEELTNKIVLRRTEKMKKGNV